MASLTPEQSRDFMAATVKRALHGPVDVETTRWPGQQQPPLVVEPDQAFADFKSLNEALVDPDGQEVIKTSPTRMYGIGVLYPQLTQEQEDALTVEQAKPAVDSDIADDLPAPVMPEPSPAGGGGAEETVQVSEGGIRPRSLAVSFHVPSTVNKASIAVSGARYERMPITVSGLPQHVWRRRPLTVALMLDPRSSTSQSVDADGLTLTIGVDSRPSDGGQLVTVYLVNSSEAEGDIPPRCLFQSRLEIEVSEVLPYPSAQHGVADDDAAFDLLYRRHPVLAIGHGTDARATRGSSGAWTVCTESFPTVQQASVTPDIFDALGQSYAVGMHDLASMTADAVLAIDRLIRDYRLWIEDRERELDEIDQGRLIKAGRAHLDACRAFADDMEEGWQLAQSDGRVRQCLEWASSVMNSQRIGSEAPLRDVAVERNRSSAATISVSGSNPHLNPPLGQSYWRPFQIAFILSSLPAAIDPTHPRREQVDIIWMPTGGGKTEAYLGLAAFTILWQRVKRVAGGNQIHATVDVLMRYTLRLLTAQQVQRAAALMCALEVLRQRKIDQLGDKPLRIGAFLGQASTPNTRESAVRLWNSLNHGDRGSNPERGFLLTRCPWCGAQMGSIGGTMVGYQKVPLPKEPGKQRIMAACPALDCDFNMDRKGLPVLEVDEDIYAQPPAFLVGTIDKFARLSWKGQARTLFGLRAEGDRVSRKSDPPSLLIQDELHLISGPLGSLNALYEVTIQQLCEFDGGVTPRIIAATATTRNFERQVTRLYSRHASRLVPPPALDVDDSFFARVDESRPGKTYVAVCAPGFGSSVQSQLRTIAALGQAAGALLATGEEADPWWTNLAFFSSRRSLALQLTASQAGLDQATYAIATMSGIRTGRLTEQGTRTSRRSLQHVKELTATSRDNVTEILGQLGIPLGHKGVIDLCFATSMIEVGVDVSRLGLMTVMGQPKSYSQYIQVTGRVGRSSSAPGIVFVVLSPHNVRDRSHFETFTTSHQRMYAAVEPVSITPYTPQALERGLAGAMTGLLRTTTAIPDPTPLLTEPSIWRTVEPWRTRAAALGGAHATTAIDEETNRLIRLARAATSTQPFLDWDANNPRASHPFLKALGDEDSTGLQPHWFVPNSMRSVDAEAGVNIPRGIAPAMIREFITVEHDAQEEF